MDLSQAQPARRNVKVDDQAPDFTLPMHPAGDFTLSSKRGHEAVVLYFYPEDDTPGCTKQASMFRDAVDEFHQYGAGIYGVSQQDADSHRAFAEKYNLPFPLLIDEGGRVRELFGMPQPGAELRSRLTYTIDRDGTVRHITGAEPVDVEVHVQEALEWVKRLADEQESA